MELLPEVQGWRNLKLHPDVMENCKYRPSFASLTRVLRNLDHALLIQTSPELFIPEFLRSGGVQEEKGEQRNASS
jgi:hypothetical protein